MAKGVPRDDRDAAETVSSMIGVGAASICFAKDNNKPMLGRIISASLLVGCLWNVLGQGPVTASDPAVDRSTLYILFLNQHALDAKGRLSALRANMSETLLDR